MHRSVEASCHLQPKYARPDRLNCAHSSSCANDYRCREPQIIPHLLFHLMPVLSKAATLCSALALPASHLTPKISEFLKALRQMRSHYITSIYCDKRTASRQQNNITQSNSTEVCGYRQTVISNHYLNKSLRFKILTKHSNQSAISRR